MKSLRTPAAVCMTLITAAMLGASTSGDVIDDASFGDLHKMLKPQPGESRWMEIECYPSVWEGRQRAAAQGKALFLMAGSGGAPAAGCGTAGRGVSRGLAFWNDDTIKLIRENFIAVSVPTWFCQTESPEGEFLSSANVHKQWVTSSGYMTCVSASGTLLGRKPCQAVLDEFAKLPESERRPGAVKVPDLRSSDYVIPSPPADGIVLRVHARFLHRDKGGELRHAKTSDFPLMADQPRVMRRWGLFLEPNTEYMWITRDEWQSMVPDKAAKGTTISIDPVVSQRLARFHLNPKRATTSEGGIVHKRSLKTAKLELTVREVTASKINMTLSGRVHWGTDYDETNATSPNGPLAMGFETALHGRVEYDRKKKAFTRFDIVAPGHIWGRWGDANNKSMSIERPGRAPFGFALELATGETPSDRIPPGGNGRYVAARMGYFSREPK